MAVSDSTTQPLSVSQAETGGARKRLSSLKKRAIYVIASILASLALWQLVVWLSEYSRATADGWY